VIDNRRLMTQGKLWVDWGMAETLAYGTLLANGYDVRSRARTAAAVRSRTATPVLHDQDRERWDQGSYVPLQNIGRDQGSFLVIDSVLSEEAVLGFEYGFSSAEPNALVIWEAQFGDFRERRAGRHRPVHQLGRAEMGPRLRTGDAAAARLRRTGPGAFVGALERYMQLCAEYNIQVCVPVERGADLSPAAAPDAAAVPQAARRDDAEVAAAPQGCGLAAQGFLGGTFPDRDR
jgi:2-oxoglutarate dehydrogenase E1 component